MERSGMRKYETEFVLDVNCPKNWKLKSITWRTYSTTWNPKMKIRAYFHGLLVGSSKSRQSHDEIWLIIDRIKNFTHVLLDSINYHLDKFVRFRKFLTRIFYKYPSYILKGGPLVMERNLKHKENPTQIMGTKDST